MCSLVVEVTVHYDLPGKVEDSGEITGKGKREQKEQM